VHLPRPIGLTLKNAHQLAARADRVGTRTRTQATVIGPPLEGMVAENLDLLITPAANLVQILSRSGQCYGPCKLDSRVSECIALDFSARLA